MKHLFDIFETCEKNDLPDLTIALAKYRHDHPEIDHDTDKALREFMGRHYDALVDAYKAHDRAAFDAVVAECIKLDEEKTN